MRADAHPATHRSVWTAVAVVLVLGILSGCSSPAGETAATQPKAREDVASTTTGPSAVPPTSAATVQPTEPVVGAAAVLAAASAGLAAGYHFTTTVSVDGAVVMTADGDRIGEGSRLTLTGAGGNVEYVVLPGGTWVRPDGGSWEALDTTPASVDPIGALAAPVSVTVASSSPDAVTLSVTVSGVALGLSPESGDTVVDVTVKSTAISDIEYTTSADGRPAVVHAAIGPVSDTTPVSAPV